MSSRTADADIFLALRLFDPDGKEITFIGSNDPRVPVGLGWLRASQRKLDPARSLPYRPWHTHDEEWPLTPGEPVELDLEIWPTSIVVPPGYRLALTVRGKDYEVDGSDIALPNAPYPMKGVGPFLHIDPDDRPPSNFRHTQHAALRGTGDSLMSCCRLFWSSDPRHRHSRSSPRKRRDPVDRYEIATLHRDSCLCGDERTAAWIRSSEPPN